jgi:hypothetical protein
MARVPAQHAAAMRERGQPVFAEGQPLHLAIGGVVLDVLGILAAAGAAVQLGRMAVGGQRQRLQLAAGQRAQPVEMRRQMRGQVRRQIQAQQPRERRIGAPEIDSVAVRNRGSARGRRDGAQMHGGSFLTFPRSAEYAGHTHRANRFVRMGV